jgi:hypothetical protein
MPSPSPIDDEVADAFPQPHLPGIVPPIVLLVALCQPPAKELKHPAADGDVLREIHALHVVVAPEDNCRPHAIKLTKTIFRDELNPLKTESMLFRKT